jgi:uncharacterized protein (DUF2147 family)
MTLLIDRNGNIIKAVLVLISAAMAGGAFAAGSPDTGLLGNWARGDGNVRIHIARCGGKFCAVNTWVRDTTSGEAVGDRLIMTLQPKSPSALDGEAHDVKRDLTYSMGISLDGAKMTTQGCVLIGVVCKTASWTRLPN